MFGPIWRCPIKNYGRCFAMCYESHFALGSIQFWRGMPLNRVAIYGVVKQAACRINVDTNRLPFSRQVSTMDLHLER